MRSDWEEKRRSPRVPVDLNARYSHKEKSSAGKLLNLSVDGCFLQASELFDPGDPLELSFQLPAADQPLNIKGNVAWGGMIGGASRSFGIGIQFEEIPPSDKDQIEAYLRDLLKT